MFQSLTALAADWDALLGQAQRSGRLEVGALTQLLADPAAAGDAGVGLDLQDALALAARLPPFWRDPAARVVLGTLPVDSAPTSPGPGHLRWQRAPDGTLHAEAHGAMDVGAWAAAMAQLGLHAGRARALAAIAALTPVWSAHPAPSWAQAWGLDGDQLAAGHGQHRDLVESLAAARWPAPQLRLTPACSPHRQRVGGRRPAQQARVLLAEGGLASRPLHVWMGPTLLVDCLSPYPRDLAQPLADWAAANPAQAAPAGMPGGGAAGGGQDWLAAAAEIFAAGDAELAAERQQVERATGMVRTDVGRLQLTLVDTARLDVTAVDPRLGADGRAPASPAPVLLVADGGGQDDYADLLAELLAPPAAPLAELVALQAGLGPPYGAARPWLAGTSLSLAGGHLRALPTPPPEPGDLVVGRGGSELVAPCPQLAARGQRQGGLAPHLAQLPLHACRVGGSQLAELVHDGHLTGALDASVPVSLVTWPGPLPRGPVRPGSPGFAALLALSLAAGSRLLGGGRPPSPAAAPAPGGPARGGWPHRMRV